MAVVRTVVKLAELMLLLASPSEDMLKKGELLVAGSSQSSGKDW